MISGPTLCNQLPEVLIFIFICYYNLFLRQCGDLFGLFMSQIGILSPIKEIIVFLFQPPRLTHQIIATCRARIEDPHITRNLINE